MQKQSFVAGKYLQQNRYKSFSPSLVNKSFNWQDAKIDVLLEEARGKLGELNAYSVLVPDVDFFIEMHILKEATTSSRIEGTQTGMDEALLPQSEIKPERQDDWSEVQNYIKAMNHAIANLEKLPLSMRILKDGHKILLAGVRGKHKLPGEIRISQNWIGGATLNDASFIPPHYSEVPTLISDLENFWHNSAIDIPELIRIAITHYQFETIHPFLDGNGRIGRLLITLYLVDKKLLHKPTLYISDFLQKHRGEYYDSLTRVRTSNDIEHWIKFFLVAIAKIAEQGIATFEKIIKLRRETEQKLMLLGRRTKISLTLLEHLWSKPIIDAKKVEKVIGISKPSANTLIKEFEKLEILEEITGHKRDRLFIFSKYTKLFEES